MNPIYNLVKGDPLCPLGFHPQVKWPSKCKRCFRDYKHHWKKRDSNSNLHKDVTTSSTPSLSINSREDERNTRIWMSSTNLADDANLANDSPSSWTSTKDLANMEDDTQPVTVNLQLPRKKIKPLDTGQRSVSDSVSLPKPKQYPVFDKNDSLAERARKLQALKDSADAGKRIQIKEVKTISDEPTNHDVQFLIQVKSKPNKDFSDHSDDDNVSLAGTETTDTTLVDTQENELRDQLETLKKELEVTKSKCEKLERDKSDILLRRLAAMETTTSKTTASEVLKLQQKCNELQQQLEDCRGEKKSFSLKVRELEQDLDQRSKSTISHEAQKIIDDLKYKLAAAESLCEELMDENEDVKKDIKEMRDSFRELQSVEFTAMKKDLDQTTKNCRILSFKLKKTDRLLDELEFQKNILEKSLLDVPGGEITVNLLKKIRLLEKELRVSNKVSMRLTRELAEANKKLSDAEDNSELNKNNVQPLETIEKKTPTEGMVVSRESLTRGGSQDDPVQLLRDLQDSIEREADLREQLKFAEEEGENLRIKVSRIENDNESLVLQLKKMASRARIRNLSPSNQKLSPESQDEKADRFDDYEDPTELKLQLELSEQEASVLRHKVEELEGENHKLNAKIKDFQDRSSTNAKSSTKRSILSSDKVKENSLFNQKLKVLEDETKDIRKKLIEKERDCERLHAELSLTQKRSRGMQKSKSLDLDQQTLDLKRQIQVIDQEASVLRNRIQSLETENEKLSAENKKLSLLKSTKNMKADKNVDRYIDQIASLEIDLKERDDKIKELEEMLLDKPVTYTDTKSDYKKFSQRSPKRITTVTTRDQMKAMVSDLEKEIAEMLLVIKTNDNAKIKLEEEFNSKTKRTMREFEELTKKYDDIKRKLEDEKSNSDKASQVSQEVKKELSSYEEEFKKISNENISIQVEVGKLRKEKSKLIKDKKNLDDELSKVKSILKASTSNQSEMDALAQKVDSLKSSLEKKEQEISKLQLEITKISSENSEKAGTISKLKSQVTAFENKCNECDRELQEQNRTFETKIDNERQKIKVLESDQKKWEEERRKLNSQLDNLNTKLKGLESSIEQKEKLIKQLEVSLEKEKEIVTKTNSKASERESREMSKLKDELSKSRNRISEIETELEIAKKTCRTAEDKLLKNQMENKSMKSENEKKIKQFEIDIQNEKKRIEILKSNNEKEQRNRELELTSLRDKIKKLEQNGTGSPETKQLQKSISELETTIMNERRKYDELTAKYEMLEEEHVITKAKLIMERETVESQNKTLKREMEQIERELKTVRDTYNTKRDTWIKEKLEMEARLKELSKSSSNGSDSDRQRLRALLEEKQSDYEQIKKEYDNLHDQVDYMRRENEDLRKKLDDYEKVNKIQRNISADSNAMDKEMKLLQMKIDKMERSKKSDMAGIKMRYDSQINVLNGEVQSLQNQVVRFKREKDTYKHMLETAQKTIGELKQSPRLAKEAPRNITYDELEESKSKIATLEQQISCMEDEMSETRLECSRLKTELVSERSSWEVKISELHSKVNELEEEKVLNSGRTKIVGLRTKMELAWQKERVEQQRLLQETATLARDLRQTLFEVERERDKERLESKRKLDQLKKVVDEEQDENKKKLTELQCDLLELRDAHAKLRTTNEKLRREREKYDREREESRLNNSKKRSDLEDSKKINALVEQMDTLKQLAPELFFSRDNEAPYTPTPPRRTKSKSRETSPAMEKRETSMGPEEKKQQIQYIMQRLVHATEDLRKFQRLSEEEIERERLKRMGVRRATSTENDSGESRYRQPYLRKPLIPSHSNLKRKSISLEHNIQNEQKIWTNDNSMSSLNSLEVNSDIEYTRSSRDVSLDSRLSAESTQSEIGEKKKKKGLIGKLKKLTKSRSIDDQDPGTFSPSRNISKSDSQEKTEDARGSKKDLKERISSIFKKSGSSSRSNSLERKYETSCTQRPLARNGNNGHLTPSGSENANSRTKKS